MIQLLRALFQPRDPMPAHVHFHLDDHGHTVFCDESACRPTNDSPLLSALYGPPIR